MATVLFVHGTGVRKASYLETFALLEEAFDFHGIPHELKPCLWGDDLGAKPPVRSIPDVEVEAPAAALTKRQRLARWELLYRDPLFELRLLANRPKKGPVLPPGAPRPDIELWKRIEAYQPKDKLSAFLSRYRLADYWAAARAHVLEEDPVARNVLHSSPAEIGEPGQAVARAIVAALMNEARQDGRPLLDGGKRDELVDLLVEEWQARVQGIGATLAGFFGGMVSTAATPILRWTREDWSHAASPAGGDILLYQAHGARICAYIEECASQISGDVYLLAHSLGGIACVDLLRDHCPGAVKGLITAGSQAPLLYEIGALSSLAHATEPVPAHFPKWLNLYDPYDFLSYVAEPVFGDARIKDVRVESDQPFPESHSAYWTQKATWDAIAEFLA